MSTVLYSGSASISTGEYSLTLSSTSGVPASKTDDGVAQIKLDLNAMTATEQYVLKVYEKCRSGDTQRLAYQETFTGVPACPLFVSEALILANGWDATFTKLTGTDRTIGWEIRKA